MTACPYVFPGKPLFRTVAPYAQPPGQANGTDHGHPRPFVPVTSLTKVGQYDFTASGVPFQRSAAHQGRHWGGRVDLAQAVADLGEEWPGQRSLSMPRCWLMAVADDGMDGLRVRRPRWAKAHGMQIVELSCEVGFRGRDRNVRGSVMARHAPGISTTKRLSGSATGRHSGSGPGPHWAPALAETVDLDQDNGLHVPVW